MNFFNRVITEYSRKHEDEVEQDIKESKTELSSQISNLIKKTLDDGNKVWLCTDWHLWMFDKKTKTVYQRSDFNAIINSYNRTVNPSDLVIYLGDLVDGQCEKKKELGEVLKSLPGTKIMVRGNNDLFDDEYYLSNGFKYITPKFVYQNILFSHMPCKNNNRLNIHGHIHGYKTYWLPYTNQIDVAYLGGRKKPVELDDVIKAQPGYSKLIKEVPEKFDENIKQECYVDPFDD
jgi:calcineurin-like phosphoesterase family protein